MQHEVSPGSDLNEGRVSHLCTEALPGVYSTAAPISFSDLTSPDSVLTSPYATSQAYLILSVFPLALTSDSSWQIFVPGLRLSSPPFHLSHRLDRAAASGLHYMFYWGFL